MVHWSLFTSPTIREGVLFMSQALSEVLLMERWIEQKSVPSCGLCSIGGRRHQLTSK